MAWHIKMHNTDNIRIKELRALISPALLLDQLPLTDKSARIINQARQQTIDIIHGRDDRLLIIVGPCSIHDPKAALEYANKLKQCANELADDLCIIMRVYFEKPRTTVGWKGLINDPELDGSFEINKGLYKARKILLDINNLGLPIGSEFLDTIIPQYISDLTSWSAIGARTSESQIHRELSSGLSMPLGFKNSTTGNIQIAIDAVLAAQHAHHFLGISKDGIAAIVSTAGNKDCHVILRGSQQGTNYDAQSINDTLAKLTVADLDPRVMIDCSHGNSQKDHNKQKHVINNLAEQIANGNHVIMGIMIESNLLEGKQTLQPNQLLIYGQSITDACIGWNDTVNVLRTLAAAVKQRRNSSHPA